MIMPFLGQDWRSPGEQWVRTSEGWERLQLWRLKLFENLNENVLARLLKLASLDNRPMDDDIGTPGTISQPHIGVTRRTSREKNIQISLAEALMRLDMCGAAKDLKRFNYVCKLLEYLVKSKLTTLSGAAQKVVFNIMEEQINYVIKTNNNFQAVQQLLKAMQEALDRGYYDHVGSSSLWLKHTRAVERMQNKINNLQIRERSDDGKLMMSDLPDDCIREILMRLAHHQDLVSTGLTEMRTFKMIQDTYFWKSLCLFHFTDAQWKTVVRRGEDLESLGWSKLYHRLAKRYGLKDVFAEMLHLCRHCNTLFWENHGHVCLVPNQEPQSRPISPAMCVELFTG